MNQRHLPVLLDCAAGRALGCESVCCRLIVRLRDGEADPGGVTRPGKRCVDKDPADGLCIYFDRMTKLCKVWDTRPSTCREYDCNFDPLVQAVLANGFLSIVQAAKDAVGRKRQQRVSIPRLEPVRSSKP